MSFNRVALIRVIAFLAAACESAPEQQRDTSSAARIDTAPLTLSHDQLVTACRDTAARASPKVQWATDTSLTADLTYDGSPELVVWGADGDSAFIVSIVECSGNRPGRVWSLPLNTPQHFGTNQLEVALTDPSFGDAYFAENCIKTDTTAECAHLRKIESELKSAYAKGGRGLSVGVQDRDHIYVYWDPELAKFASWTP
jgi:hypothetical protein